MSQKPTPSFVLALPLCVNSQQATHFQAHFECARQLYNALLAEAMKRLTRMKADPAWQTARTIPRSDKHARRQAFARLRTQYGFSEFGLHEAAKRLRTSWRASAHRQPHGAEAGQPRLPGSQSGVCWQGADCRGFVYSAQLILEGYPLNKPKNLPGKGTVGLDLGPSTVAIVSGEGTARLLLLAEELAPDGRKRRRLQRHLERQRRANNAEHYDEKGRIRTRSKGQGRRVWRESQGYQRTRRRLATTERRLAAHRRSLHGKLANQIIRLGDDVRLEKVSYKGWQRRFGRSVGLRAPGRFVDAVKCVVARTRTAQLHEIPTVPTKLSQYCHRCELYTRKPLAQRFHDCPHCGLGSDRSIQRDLYAAWLASVLDPIRLTFPSRGQLDIRLPEHGGVLVGRPGGNPTTCERARTPAPLRHSRS